MQRDLARLARDEFDLAIVGGGIYGAALADEAAGRGLRVALLEKGDFCAATSANSLKTIHGGFRYLQHLDLARMRASLSERRILMQLAPHLVHPLPVIVPTYGHGAKGREMLALGLLANDVLGLDRNRRQPFRRHSDPGKRVPRGRSLSRAEVLERLPALERRGLSGGALFYDAQAANTERLGLLFVRRAFDAGAAVANYARVAGLQRSSGAGPLILEVSDELSGQVFEVRAKRVILAGGPWVDDLLALFGAQPPAPIPLALAVNLVFDRELFGEVALGLLGNRSYQDDRTVAKKGGALLFVTPWQGRAILGTSYRLHPGVAGEAPLASERDVSDLLEAFTQVYPAAGVTHRDVSFVHAGLLPAQPGAAIPGAAIPGAAIPGAAKDGSVRLLDHPLLRDHSLDGLPGVYSLIGVKYTTARAVAQHTIDRLAREWARPLGPSQSAHRPLPGGDIEDWARFLAAETARRPCGLPPDVLLPLLHTYGADYLQVLACLPGQPAVAPGAATPGAATLSAALLQAQARHAARFEMASRLSDLILRRTSLGSAAHPGRAVLETCAAALAGELGWDPARTRAEIDAVDAAYRVAV